MKFFILIGASLISFSSFACIELGNELKICTGDTVFQGPYFSSGAKVVAINPKKRTATVKDNSTSELSFQSYRDLDLTRGCVQNICVGDTVFQGPYFPFGAKVVAVNPSKGTATVESNSTRNLSSENLRDLDVTRGCVQHICVGDTVFQGPYFPFGAKVVAVNRSKETATVMSNSTGNLSSENPKDLDVTDACLDFENERNL